MLLVVKIDVFVNLLLSLLVNVVEEGEFGMVGVRELCLRKILEDSAATGFLNGAGHAVQKIVVTIAVLGCFILVETTGSTLARTVDLHGLGDVLKSEGVFSIEHALKNSR